MKTNQKSSRKTSRDTLAQEAAAIAADLETCHAPGGVTSPALEGIEKAIALNTKTLATMAGGRLEAPPPTHTTDAGSTYTDEFHKLDRDHVKRVLSRKELATALRKALASHARDPKHALAGLTFEVRKSWQDNGPEQVKTAAAEVIVKNPPQKGLESDKAAAEADIAHFIGLTAETVGIAVSSIAFGEESAP